MAGGDILGRSPHAPAPSVPMTGHRRLELERKTWIEPARQPITCADMTQEANPYLRDAVLTASPEQLQLMLYDGAIRFARLGMKGIEEQNWEQCFDGFSRAQQIVLELLNSLNHDVDRQLCSRVAGIYNFVYRKLVEACSLRSVAPAQDAVGLLEYQRETWLLLIERLKQERAGAAPLEPAREPRSDRSDGDLAAAGYGTLCVEG